MQRYNGIIQDTYGNIIPNAPVTVVDINGNPAVVYTSNNQAGIEAQPFYTDNFGKYEFYATDGRYIATANYGGKTYTDTDILLFDPAASTGSAGVGYTPAGTGAVATTVQDQLRTLGEVITSIASLRTIPLSTNKRVFVTGYYSSGDGGGGEYWYDSTDTTTVDNGGTVIVGTDGGRWKLSIVGIVSIRQFGSKGNWNGTTGQDDTTYIQSAVNWALSSGNTRIYAPDPNINCAYKITSTITMSNGTFGVRLDGSNKSTTQFWSYVTGTTPVFLYSGTPTSYIGAGLFSLSVIAKNPGGVGARNSGSGIKLQGATGVFCDNVYFQDLTYGVWLHNVTNTWTEQTKLNVWTQYCDSALRMSTADGGWPSFHGTNGYMYSDIQVGQIGLDITAGALWYNFNFDYDWVSHGAGTPLVGLIAGIVQFGVVRLSGESQGGSTPQFNLSGSGSWTPQTYVNTNGTLSSTNCYVGFRKGLILDGGFGFVSSIRATVVADGTMNIPSNLSGALCTLRNSSTGGTAVFLLDAATGVVVISDPQAFIATADPGSGTSKFWVQKTGVVTNRFAASKIIDIATIGAN